MAGNYITAYTDVDNWPNGYTDTQKDNVISIVEAIIERATKDYFYSKSAILKLDGNGKDRIFTGLSPALLTITSITSFGTTVPTSVYTFDSHSIYMDPDLLVEDPILAVQSWHLWPKGKNNIVVTCTIGWSSTPAAIKEAAVILAKAENDSTLYSRYSMNSSEKYENQSYTRKMRYMTGIQEADRLLYHYIRRVPKLTA